MNKNSLELFSLLSENSHVTDEQMQNAYKSFVEQITKSVNLNKAILKYFGC